MQILTWWITLLNWSLICFDIVNYTSELLSDLCLGGGWGAEGEVEVEVVTVDMDPQPGTDTTLTEDPLPMMTTTDTLPEMTAEDRHQRGDYFQSKDS